MKDKQTHHLRLQAIKSCLHLLNCVGAHALAPTSPSPAPSDIPKIETTDIPKIDTTDIPKVGSVATPSSSNTSTGAAAAAPSAAADVPPPVNATNGGTLPDGISAKPQEEAVPDLAAEIAASIPKVGGAGAPVVEKITVVPLDKFKAAWPKGKQPNPTSLLVSTIG
jgi:hypothetical protein